MTTEKWYKEKTAKDIVSELSRIAHESVACAKQGDKKESEKFHDEFFEKFNSVIPAIVDIKTEYWAYREVNQVYNEWDKCHTDLLFIKKGMEDDLWNIFKDM